MRKLSSEPVKNSIRVFLAGGVSDSTVGDVERYLKDGVNVCGIIAHKKLLGSAAKALSVPLWFYDQLDNPALMKSTIGPHHRYEECLRSILSEPRTSYFCERHYGVKGQHSVFNHTVQVELACWNSLAILSQTNPDRLVYMNVNHQLFTWIFGRCAEYLGIPTYFTVASPLPWRYWAVKGNDELQVLNIDPVVTEARNFDSLSEKTRNYIDKITQNYNIGMPANHKRHLQSNNGNIWCWKNEIQKALALSPVKLAGNAVRLYRKYKLYEAYNKLAYSDQLSEPYIVFFLHYQPEATTLPRGLGFVQQWLVVRTLSSALPQGYKLVVKEHPAIFINRITESIRDISFYKAMAELPQVELAPLGADPFELIDHCRAAVTVTGSAGFEALCRNKPVLVFGNAAYRGCQGVYPIKNIAQAAEALKLIFSGATGPTREELVKYLHWVERNSEEGFDPDGNADPFNRKIRSEAKIKIWASLIKAGAEPLAASFQNRRDSR